MIVSTCGRLWSSCQKFTSSFISFSRYYILRNTAIWLFDSTGRDTEFVQVWDWWWNINNNISFISVFFHEKLRANFSKNQKNPILGLFRTLFSQICGKTNFPEKMALSVLKYSNYLCQNLKKLMSFSWEKCWTYRKTDRQWSFYMTRHRTELQLLM